MLHNTHIKVRGQVPGVDSLLQQVGLGDQTGQKEKQYFLSFPPSPHCHLRMQKYVQYSFKGPHSV